MAKIRVNQTIFSGYVPRDPFVNNENTFLAFTVGIDKSYMNTKKEWVNMTAWIPVKLWANEARIKNVASKIKQGCYVLVTGTMDQTSYKSQKDGSTVNDIFLRATSIQILEEPSTNSNNTNNSNNVPENNYSSANYSENYQGGNEEGNYDFGFLNDIGNAY